jgi:hypothetical protein
MERHESLRTSFELSGDTVVQKIASSVPFRPGNPEGVLYGSPEEALDNFVKPFDLTRPGLFRCACIRTDDGKEYLLVDIHHIICDGLSLNILMNDFRKIYQGQLLSPLPLRYADYAAWQYQDRKTAGKQRKYWVDRLSGELPVLELPVMQERSKVDRHPADHKVLVLDGDSYAEVKKLCVSANVSEFMFFLSVYYILLAKITGNTDILIGTDAAGRTAGGLTDIVGTFINLLPLRINVDPGIDFAGLLQEVKACVLDAFEHQDFQYEQMTEHLGREGRLADNWLPVHFSFANYLSAAGSDSLGIVPIQPEKKTTTQFEFKIEAISRGGQLSLLFIYSKALYDENTISLFVQYYHDILRSVLKSKKTTVDKSFHLLLHL